MKKSFKKKQKQLETYDYNDFTVERIYPFNIRKLLKDIKDYLQSNNTSFVPDFLYNKFSLIYIEITCSDTWLLLNTLSQLSPYVSVSKKINNTVTLVSSIEKWSQVTLRYTIREKTEFNRPNTLEQKIFSVIVESIKRERNVLDSDEYIPYSGSEYKEFISEDIMVYYPPSNRYIARFLFVIKNNSDKEIFLNHEKFDYYEFDSCTIISISILEIPTILDILKMSGYEQEVSNIIKHLIDNVSFEFAKIITFYEEDNYLSNDSYYKNIDEVIE